MGGKPHIADHDGLRGHIGGRIDLGRNEEKAGTMGGIHAMILPPLRFFVQFPLRFGISEVVTSFTSARIMLLTGLLLACPLFPRANIRYDIGQLRGHFGGAKDMGGQMLFQHDGYSICVYFDGSHAAMEVFVRDGSKKDKKGTALTDITQDDVDQILAKEGVGLTWNQVQTAGGKTTWLRSDNKLIARLSVDSKSNDKTLMIMVNEK